MTSACDASRSSTTLSVIDACAKWNWGWPSRCAMFSIRPVDRLSIDSTRWPAASSTSEKCEPMKPAPPVIRYVVERAGGTVK